MKRNLVLLFLSLVATLFIAAAGAFVWWNNSLQAPSTNSTKKEIIVAKGSSAEKIAIALKNAGIIKSDLVFRLYVKLHKLGGSLPSGEFTIAQNLSVPEVVALILKGPNEVWVTIPEGLRREQIPSRFSEALGHTPSEARAYNDQFLEESKDDEGYLFPETYLVPKDISASKVVSLLYNTFQKKFGASFSGSKSELKNVVILASLLERETRSDSEKPVISGVITNRLRVGMPLQIDATVQYSKATKLCGETGAPCETWWPTVYLDDYKLSSQFNTYLIPGLPPLPISNPGLKSLMAAANPEQNDYFYYIHDKSGLIHTAKTIEEHNANVQKYLR